MSLGPKKITHTHTFQIVLALTGARDPGGRSDGAGRRSEGPVCPRGNSLLRSLVKSSLLGGEVSA